MTKLEEDLHEAIDGMGFHADAGLITERSIKPLQDEIRRLMSRVGGWILDGCTVTLDDENEFIDVSVTHGKVTATRSLRVESPITGKVILRVDTDGDGV